MSRHSFPFRVVVCLLVAVTAGCAPQQPFYLFEDGDLSHYRGMATELEVPDVDVASLAEVEGATRPLSLTNLEPKEYWDLTLEEAVKIALANSKVIRTLTGTTVPDSLTRSPGVVSSIYDPALNETDPRFGPAAALSAFDTQFGTSVFWERNDRPVNVGGTFGTQFIAREQKEDLGTFQATLSKYNRTGGQTSFQTNIVYDKSNSPTRAFPSDWTADITAQFSQPLLQGAGVQFNGIAGPGAIPGFYNGVVIARINTDIELVNFEGQVRNMLSDLEQAYWRLSLAYRELDAVAAGRDSALTTYRQVRSLFDVGGEGGELANEAQAAAQYYLFRSEFETRQNEVFAAEAQLRYMMGLAPTDGRLIRPADEMTTAKVSFDWYETKCEAMARNVDLRQQKWRVKKAELELIASKNFLLPRVDLSGMYRWRGLGDHFWDTTRKVDVSDEYDNALQSLTGGDYQEYNFGVSMSFPLGFRKEMAGVRNAQLTLAKQKVVLQEQEVEVAHQLAANIRDVEKGVVITQSNYNRVLSARRELRAVEAAFREGTITLYVVLDAQKRLAEAEVAFYRSLYQYTVAILGVHYRKGSLLEYNGVYLAEGPWPGKAYFDARRRARARDAALFIDYGFTRPKVISRGAYEQHAGRMSGVDSIETIETPEPELVPTPAPEQPKAGTEGDAPTVTQAGHQPSADWPHLFGPGPKRQKPRVLPSAAGRLAAKLRKSTRSDGRTTGGAGDVKLVSYELRRAVSHGDGDTVEKDATEASVGKWRSIKRSSDPPNESRPNPTSSETAWTASGGSGL